MLHDGWQSSDALAEHMPSSIHAPSASRGEPTWSLCTKIHSPQQAVYFPGDDGTDTGEGSSSSSIDDDDLAPDELAAVSAADSARHGASSRQVADDTAYLDAMLAAEHAYDKRQQQQQGGIGAKGSEDPLFKRANSQKQVCSSQLCV